MARFVRVWGVGGVVALAACFVDTGGSPATGGPTSAATDTTAATGAVTSGVAATDATASGEATTTTTTTTTTTGSITTVTTESETTTTATTGALASSSGDATSGGGASTGGEPPVPGCVPLYYNDFSEEPTDLARIGVWVWDEANGEMVTQTPPGQFTYAFVPNVQWTDVSVYARVRVADAGSAGVRIRGNFAEPASNYYASIRPTDASPVRFGKTINGFSSAFINMPGAVAVNTWYVVHLQAVGEELAMDVNGIVAKAKDAQLPAGSAAIGGYDGSMARFDWFLVCAE